MTASGRKPPGKASASGQKQSIGPCRLLHDGLDLGCRERLGRGAFSRMRLTALQRYALCGFLVHRCDRAFLYRPTPFRFR